MDPHINYICTLGDNAGSLEMPSFMGFTPGVVELPERICVALYCAPAIQMVRENPETIVKFKLLGQWTHRIRPINIDAFPVLLEKLRESFCVVLTTKSQDAEITARLSKHELPILHLTSEMVSQISKSPRLGNDLIRGHMIRFAEYYAGQSPKLAKLLLANAKQKVPQRLRLLRACKRNHGVTLPNETVLEILGYSFESSQHLPSTDEQDYVEAIQRSTVLVREERERLLKSFGPEFIGPSLDLILACPGLLQPHWTSLKTKKTAKKIDGIINENDARRAVNFWTRQEGYATPTSSSELEELSQNPMFHILRDQWTGEMAVFNTLLTLLSANEFCPTVRLPRRLNRVRVDLRLLGDVVRKSGRNNKTKAHKIARRIGQNIEVNLLPVCSDFLTGANRQIQVAADVPVEWARIEGVPLQLKHFVSRVQTTPGNLFSMQAISSEVQWIRIDNVKKFYVIRSFLPHDRLRRVFETCLEGYAKQDGWKLEYEIIDVNTESDFVNAFNRVDSPFVVFDGHGGHSRDTEVGGIWIGGQLVDIWSLKGRVVRMPPIVLLSACDTSAADRSHASPALGFLMLGATTVLGTMFPVHGIKSGLMMARLIYRITSVTIEWMNIHKVPLPWIKIVGCQIRASYISELLHELLSDGVISEKQFLDISHRAVNAINCFHPNWLSFFEGELLQEISWSPKRLQSFINERFYLPDALIYTQLGRPEKIIFYD